MPTQYGEPGNEGHANDEHKIWDDYDDDAIEQIHDELDPVLEELNALFKEDMWHTYNRINLGILLCSLSLVYVATDLGQEIKHRDFLEQNRRLQTLFDIVVDDARRTLPIPKKPVETPYMTPSLMEHWGNNTYTVIHKIASTSKEEEWPAVKSNILGLSIIVEALVDKYRNGERITRQFIRELGQTIRMNYSHQLKVYREEKRVAMLKGAASGLQELKANFS